MPESNSNIWIKASLICFFLVVILELPSFSQAGLHYRTRQPGGSTGSGNWNTPTIWETSATGTDPWTVATVSPNSTSLTINIVAGSIVSLPAGFNVTVDQVTNNGTISVKAGSVLTVAEDGTSAPDFSTKALSVAGGTLNIQGTLVNTSTFAISSGSINVSGTVTNNIGCTISGMTSANTSFLGTSRYRHLASTENIPYAVWSPGSTVEIAGYTGSIALTNASWTQAFSNVDFNCTGLASGRVIDFNGRLSNIGGNLSITSTGGSGSNGKIVLAGSAGSLTIGGSFISSAFARAEITHVASNATFTVNGDFTSAGMFTFSSHTSGTGVLNVKGNFSVPAGGSLTTVAAGPGATLGIGTIRFNGTGIQSFSKVGGIANNINYVVPVGSTLDVGTSAMTGTGTLLLAGTIRLGSLAAAGAMQAAGSSSGNTQMRGTRSFSSGSTIIYNGTGAQTIGNGHPGTESLGVDVIIDNSSGVSFASGVTSMAVTGQLTLLNGPFTVDAGKVLSMTSNSTLVRTAGSLLGSAPSSGPYDLIYDGGNTTTGLESQGALNDVSVNVSGTVTLANSITASGTLSVNTGVLAGGSHNITVGEVINSATLDAPSLNLTTSGNFTNNGTFNNNGGTVTFSGSSSILGSVPSVFHNVTITGTLTGPAQLRLQGNFTNNGVFTAGSNEVSFEGAGVQAIEGSTVTNFNNISITNQTAPYSVRVESDHNLLGVLTLGANAVFDANGACDCGEFTLISTGDSPGVDAAIAALGAGASVVDSISIQRFWSAEGTINRYIAIPVTNARVSSLQDDFSVTGSFTGTSYPCTGCRSNGGSLRYYDETRPGSMSVGYTVYPTTNNSALLTNGRGYLAYMWQSIPVTLDVRGAVRQGNFSFPISYTSSGSSSNDGWNLLGNPYPAPIQFNNNPAAWPAKTNVNNYVYVTDMASSVFRYWDPTNNVGDLTNGIIAPGQAFWIKANAASPVLSITEQAKTLGSAYQFFRQGQHVAEHLKISLSHDKITDNAFLVNSTEYSEAPKLVSPAFEIAIFREEKEDKNLVMQTFQSLTDGEVIPLSVRISEPGQYEISFSATEGFDYTGDLTLIDKLEATQIRLVSDSRYAFTINTPGFISDRFVLVYGRYDFSDLEVSSIAVYPNPAADILNVRVLDERSVSVQIFNEVGQEISSSYTRKGNNGSNQCRFSVKDYPNGLYYVKVASEKGNVVRKFVKQ